MMSCSKQVYMNRIRSYFNASAVPEKSRYMSNDFHSFFIEKNGNGMDKETYLKEFRNWDGPLHPDVTIISHDFAGQRWTIQLLEQNDFSKLIGFPGWKAEVKLLLDKKGSIHELIYIPDKSNPDYKKWLQPALDWMKKNNPSELDKVYSNGKLIRTEEAAKKWVVLLNEWKQKS